ncbi:zeta toxin family protein [Vibrio anguillarum]|uniref:zeta toxin family protein n=1 Tax=Vibrio anguillarum TaxID=55601 RepID=UPI0018FEE227|nr:zeta toxin family protein [Vibrio anguillarum]MBF4424152.1 hypothetical protein [Vibrio anguillarum]
MKTSFTFTVPQSYSLERATSLQEPFFVKQVKNVPVSATQSALELRQRRVKDMDDNRFLSEPSDKINLLKHVQEKLCQGVTPQEQPSAFVVTGQMGAGKSTAIKACSSQLKNNCVVVDYDELKKYIPGYSELASNGHPSTVSNCQQTALFLCEGLIKYGLEKKFNMVIQRSMLDQQHSILHVLDDCKKHGFKTHLTVLAVDKSLSMMGVFTRYESALKSIREGKLVPDGARRTPLNKHDEAYSDMESVEKFQELLPLLDTITVTSRAGIELYTGRNPDEIVKALQDGRMASKNDKHLQMEAFNTLIGLVRYNVQFPNYDYN